MSTSIEWVQNPDGSKGETWNPVTGCTPCSIGCTNCYAARMAATRLKHHPRYAGLATIESGRARWTGEVRLNYDVLEQPLHWKKPRRIFVASMGDLFHGNVPYEFIERIYGIMRQAKQHIFQVLTKRPGVAAEFLLNYILPSPHYLNKADVPLIWPNVHLGVSVENQAAADERIPWLLQIPAAVRFISVEPYLSEIDLSDLHCGISWCIIGAESGPGARPMDENWVRRLIAQCKQYKIPVFYKQKIVKGKRVSIPVLDGRQYAEFPLITHKPNAK